MLVTRDCPSCGGKMRLADEERAFRCPECHASMPAPGHGGKDYGQAETLHDAPEGGGKTAWGLGLAGLVLAVAGVGMSWLAGLSLAGLVCGIAGLLVAGAGSGFAAARRPTALLVSLPGVALGLVALVLAALTLRSDTRPTPAAPAAPATPGAPAARKLGDWGEAIDPDGDCTVRLEKGTLTMAVPDTPHDLSAELGRVNAPRVLREVEGDFTVQVKVSGTIRPGAAGTIPTRVPFQSGGLLLWQDALNYVRLERAAVYRDGRVLPYVLFEKRADGQVPPAATFPVEDQPVYLRLERRGDQLSGSVSPDGVLWKTTALDMALPRKVRVGADAVNAARQPLTVRFEEYKLSP